MKIEWVFIAAMLLISFIGIFGNVVSVFVVIKEKLFKQRIWFYLLSLLFSDIYSATVSLPLTVATFYDKSILQIRSICILQGSTMNFLMGWSLITIGTINAWKYISIKSSLIDRFRSRSWLIVFICIILSISGFLAIATILGMSRYIHQAGRKWCVVDTKDKYRSLLFVLVAAFLILCFIVVFCNVATFRYVRKEMQAYSQKYHVNEPMENIFNRRKYRVLQTTFMVTVMFLVCWAPLFTMILIEGFGGNVPLLYAKISYFCALAQGCVNPIVYYFGHSAFKKQFKKISGFWKWKGNKVSDTEGSKTDIQETGSASF